jgi:hypothetical protein
MATKKKNPEAVALAVKPIFATEEVTAVTDAVFNLTNFGLIEHDADRESAEEVIKKGKGVRKAIEVIRMSFTKPLDEQKKKVMDEEKKLVAGLESGLATLTLSVNTYLREQHQKAEAERARLAEEEEKRLSRLRSPASIAKVQTEFEEKRAEVAAPTAGVRMDTKYEVIDLNQVPRELLMIDPDKVKKLLASGAEHCAGLRIWKEPSRSGR